MFSPNLGKIISLPRTKLMDVTVVNESEKKMVLRCSITLKVYQLKNLYCEKMGLEDVGFFYSEKKEIMLPYLDLIRYAEDGSTITFRRSIE